MTNLSVLNNCGPGMVTYYVGNNPMHLEHLKDCIVYCNMDFRVNMPGITIVNCEDPQLEFYKSSSPYKNSYLNGEDLFYDRNDGYWISGVSKIHKNAIISPGVVIGKSCVIEEGVYLGPNVVIYDNTTIKSGTSIDANSVIGAAGMMWIWEGDKKVYLEQLGGVIIEENCRIGSLVEITRGSANENTIIGKDTCISHGTSIGHGCVIGASNHLANGVKMGGGCSTADFCFIGSGVIFSAGTKVLAEDVILGAGSVITKSIKERGVYFGSPAKKQKNIEGDKLSGMPMWR